MKSSLWSMICFCLLIAAPASAEELAPAAESEAESAPSPAPALRRSPEELEKLFGAIALYPDALVALILPASTVPSDVVLASRFLEANGNINAADKELWDDSVKALLHYPQVITWMDQNLAWTKQAGEAFLEQPSEVMNSIQRLRFKARAAGTLVNTPQQQIVVEGDTIRIIPAQTNVIYVPVYDPAVVYVTQTSYYTDPFLTFGLGWATGYWLAYDCDWGHRRIWTVDPRYRERYWHDHADWRRPNYPGRADYGDGNYHHQAWGSPSNYSRPSPYSGSHSRSDGDGPNHYVNNGSRNRPPRSDAQGNGANSTPGNHDDRSSSDNRGTHSHNRPEAPGTPTTGVFTPPQPNRVARPATPSVSPQSPQSAPQDHRDRRDRNTTASDGVRNAGNTSTPNVPRVQPPQRPTQQSADRSDSVVRVRERPTMPMPVNSAVEQNRSAPMPTPPPTRSMESNSSQVRFQAPAPARVQSASSDQSSSSGRSDHNHRADRVQSD